MSQDKDALKQKKLYKIYSTLVSQKSEKLELMQVVKRYMRPSFADLLVRYKKDVSAVEVYRNALFDNTCQNKMAHFSISSLSDIINPFHPWFSLNVLNPAKDMIEPLREWSIKAGDAFLDFINKSSYYKALMVDKRNFDLYGFSSMTIVPKEKGMIIKSEDPFSVLLYEDDTGIIGIMWEKRYTAHSMEKLFNYVPKDGKANLESMRYTVICACFPNSSDFINNVESEQGGKYVQLYLLKKEELYSGDKGAEFDETLGSDESFMGEEIGKRKYFSELISCVARDSFEDDSSYGEGWGKKILVTASNLNQIRRNLIKSAEFAGNPSFMTPHDIYRRFKSIQPGQTYTNSAIGEKIELIDIKPQLGELAGFLDVEKSQVNESVPVVGMPQQKKQRQSQMEVQKMLQEASKNSFIYKVVYLNEGVGQHLKKMFNIAVDAGVIPEPPEGVDLKDVEPSLSNVILKELKKSQARAFVESLNMSQGFLSLFREGADNYKMDYILKTIMEATGGGSGIEEEEVVNSIREQRQKIQQDKINRDNMTAEAGLAGAQAGLAQARTKQAEAEVSAQQ